MEDNRSSSTRSVGFSTVEIHEHPMILGDHPLTKEGPSLEIDWNSQDRRVVDVDEYENTKPKDHHLTKLLSINREDM